MKFILELLHIKLQTAATSIRFPKKKKSSSSPSGRRPALHLLQLKRNGYSARRGGVLLPIYYKICDNRAKIVSKRTLEWAHQLRTPLRNGCLCKKGSPGRLRNTDADLVTKKGSCRSRASELCERVYSQRYYNCMADCEEKCAN
jgi:hypothetical protein